jgi:hypothetical protein
MIAQAVMAFGSNGFQMGTPSAATFSKHAYFAES